MMSRMLSAAWRIVKPLIASISPSAAQNIPSWRMYRRCKARFGPFQDRIKPLLFGENNPVILSGAFKGTAYFDEIGFGGPITPKWVGGYESELHGVIEDVLAHPPERIVDIGSAEGCYAVLLTARLTREDLARALDEDRCASCGWLHLRRAA